MKYDRSQFEPPLEHGIEKAVLVLRENGIETFESCQGGDGHSSSHPMVRFHGGLGEGHKALGIALIYGLPVSELLREWTVIDEEPTGPYWRMVFYKQVPLSPEEMAYGAEFNDPFRPNSD